MMKALTAASSNQNAAWNLMAVSMFVSLAFGPLVTATAGQDVRPSPTIGVSVSKESVYVADPVDITITVLAEEPSTVSLGPIPSKLGDFDVVDYAEQLDLPAQQAGKRIWIRRLTLESLVAGANNLPPFEALVEMAGKTTKLQSRPVNLNVRTTLSEESDPLQPSDIAGTMDVDVPSTNTLSASFQNVTLTLIGCGALLLVVWGFAKQRSRLPTPLQQAKRDLAMLAKKAHQIDVEPQRTIRNTEHILREFIECQTGIPATKLTINELTNQLSDFAANSSGTKPVAETSSPSNSTTLDKLRDWLSELERVRFSLSAGDQPNPKKLVDEANEMLDQLSQWLGQANRPLEQGG